MLLVLVLAFLHWFRVARPAVRAIAFLLPLFVPVALATASHVLLPERPSTIPHFKPLEAFINVQLAHSAPLLVLFLLLGIVGIAASLVLVWHQWRALRQVHRTWQWQQQYDLPLRQRCDTALNALACRLGYHVPRLVLVGERSAGSLALGWCSYIFVPQAMVPQLDDEELEALLAHEMGHIIRKDGLLDCLARICRNLMLFNPVAYLALDRFESEQEEATDALAVTMGSNKLALASCLLKGYRLGDCGVGVPVTGLLGSHSAFERRVRKIINATQVGPSPKIAWVALGLFAGAAVVVLGLAL